MSKGIVWRMPDGSISVTIGATGGVLDDLARLTQERTPWMADAVRLDDVEISVLPGRYFRNCWRDNGNGNVHVNMPLARTQRMKEIRSKRDSLLTESDKEKFRLDDVGTKTETDALAIKRQALRDIPQNVDLEVIDTPEALEAFEPDWPR